MGLSVDQRSWRWNSRSTIPEFSVNDAPAERRLCEPKNFCFLNDIFKGHQWQFTYYCIWNTIYFKQSCIVSQDLPLGLTRLNNKQHYSLYNGRYTHLPCPRIPLGFTLIHLQYFCIIWRKQQPVLFNMQQRAYPSAFPLDLLLFFILVLVQCLFSICWVACQVFR